MAHAADPVSQQESRLGGLSLICLALGVVGPFFSALALGLVNNSPVAGVNPVVVAVGIRVAFVLLALVLGIFSRRSRMGRLGLLGSTVLLSVVLLFALFVLFRPAATPVSLPSLPPPS
jgi:hypothetical protein